MVNEKQTKICIIGAGPAGLMAAIHSAGCNAGTLLLESNKTAAHKLLLTGGGRCNFTHIATIEELVQAFESKGRFLRHSFYQFPPESVRLFFQKHGLESKVEDNGCVFPVSNRANEVRDILLAEAKKLGVHFVFSAKVGSVTKHREHFIVSSTSQKILAEKLIIATGGLSYPPTQSVRRAGPPTGSTRLGVGSPSRSGAGNGYKFARHFGHTIIEPRASLVPLVTHESWPSELTGTSLDNVKITASFSKKKIAVTGSMLFTHDGIGGPAVFELSRFITDFLPSEKNPLKIFIDLVGGIDEAEFGKIILRQASEHPKKTVVNILTELVPKRVSQVLCRQLDIPDKLYANQLSKDLRKKLLHILKAIPLSIVRTRPIAEAMVTRGGVNVAEIEPKTMESRICPGLFFAGEVINVDGPCGGYNLQMCWSTGALAGLSAATAKGT